MQKGTCTGNRRKNTMKGPSICKGHVKKGRAKINLLKDAIINNKKVVFDYVRRINMIRT